jgi:gamma-glutamylaminecyclotransferase
MPEHLLFVYGTLKLGGSNHHLMADSVFRGEARTEACYRLCDLGDHPGMVRVEAPEHGLAIHGEIFAVSDETRRTLDEFEGHPTVYERRPIVLPGLAAPVEAYVYLPALPAEVTEHDRWPFG